MGDVIVVQNRHFLQIIRNMYEQGEITIEQYAGCLRRAIELKS